MEETLKEIFQNQDADLIEIYKKIILLEQENSHDRVTNSIINQIKAIIDEEF